MSAYTSADYERLIAKLNDDLAAAAARAVAREREHAADLRAARGALSRWREAVLAGHLDVTQVRAASIALAVIEHGRMLDSADARALAAAFLALAEAYKAHRAKVAP